MEFDYTNLKEGDKVFVLYGTGCRTGGIGFVTKVTNTLIEINGNMRFSRKTGYRIGDRFCGSKICEFTPEIEKEFNRDRLIRYVSHYAQYNIFSKITNEELITIKTILDNYKE
jgi:hypothetical protein